MIVPFTPGSPNDVVARLLAQHLTTRLGQNVVIDNRPGGGTTIGAKVAASAEPNGYTLLFNSSSIVVAPAMYKNPGYDPLKSFVPVANAVFGHWTTVVLNSIPANTVPEFVAYARKNPGKLTFGYGQGTAPQLVGEWLKVREKLDMTSVPYKGGAQVITDMLGGRIHFHVGSASTLDSAHQERQPQGDLGLGAEARSGTAGRADHDRERLSGSGAGLLGRRVRAGRHAGGDREAAQRSDQRQPALAGDEGEPRQARPRAGDPDAGGVRQFIVDEYPRWKEIVTVSGVKGD